MAGKDYSQMSDEELLARAKQLGYQAAAPDYSHMSDEELLKHAENLGYKPSDEPVITEKPVGAHEDFGSVLKGGLDATVGFTGQALGNFTQGTAKGFDDLAEAGAQAMGAALHVPMDSSERLDAFQGMLPPGVTQAAAQGAKEHPVLSGFIQGAGAAMPTAPVFEIGAAAAAPKVLSLAKPALRATGPVGGALISGLQQMGGEGQQFLQHLAQQGVGGALAGMQQATTEMMLEKQKKNPVLRLGMAALEGATGAMALGTIGKSIESTIAGGIKSAGKMKLKFQEMQAKHQMDNIDRQRQAVIDQIEAQKAASVEAYNQQTRRSQEQLKAEQQAKARRDKMRADEQKSLDDLRKAKEEQQAFNVKRARDEAARRKQAVDEEKRQALSEQQSGEQRHRAESDAAYRARKQQQEAAQQEADLQEREHHRQRVANAEAAYEQRRVARVESEKAAQQDRASVEQQSRSDMYAPSVQRSPQQIANEQKARKLRLTNRQPSVSEAPPGESAPPVVAPSGGHSLGSEWTKPLEGSELAGYDKNEYATPRYRQRVAGYKNPQTVGHPGDTRAEIELAIRDMEDAAVLRGDTTDEKVAASRAKRPGGNIPDEQLRAAADEASAARRLEDSAASRAVKELTNLGMNGAAAVSWARGEISRALTPESRLAAAQTIEHVAGWTQRGSHIYKQYDPALAAALGKAGQAVENLEGLFQDTRAAVKLSLQKSGGTESKLWIRALKGTLGEQEQAALTPQQRTAIEQARQAIDDYKNRIDPVIKALDEMQKRGEITKGSGLGRLNTTLKIQRSEVVPVSGVETGNADRRLGEVQGAISKTTLFGKAAVSVFHAFDKLIVAAFESPGALSRAIRMGNNSHVREFTQNFLGDSIGPISEAAKEDFGIEFKSKAGKLFSGQYIEQLPNATATRMGLHYAAEQLGYKNGEALAADLNAARNGRGPLAYDNETQLKATRIVQDYVSELTGLNVPGFRDSNILQRNKMFAKFNMYTTAQLVQAHNGHRLFQKFVGAKTVGEATRALATLGGYSAGLYLVAGDEAPLTKEGNFLLRAAAGAPNYYHFMDAVHGARVAMHADQLPQVSHVAPSMNPLLTTSGATAVQIVRDMVKQSTSASMDDKAFKLAKTSGLAASIGLSLVRGKGFDESGTIAGKMGVGVIADYAKAISHGKRGYEMVHVYGAGPLGLEKHIADIPVETDVYEELGKQYFGVHTSKEVELTYNAQKSSDLKQWCVDNTDGETLKRLIERDHELTQRFHLNDIQERQDMRIQQAYKHGAKKDSQEVQDIKERFNKIRAEGELETKYWRKRADLWQRAADMIQRKKNLPVPMPSQNPQA